MSGVTLGICLPPFVVVLCPYIGDVSCPLSNYCLPYVLPFWRCLQVAIEGTPRQCAEAWSIIELVLERYPVVEAFMTLHPAPPPSLEDSGANSGEF